MIAVSPFGKISPPTVILSGPTRGLGRALFERLVGYGVTTVGLGRNLAQFEAIYGGLPPQVQLLEVDLGATSDELMNSLEALYRSVNSNSINSLVFVSNASIIEPIAQATVLEYPGIERVMRVNCLGPLMIANMLAKLAQEQGRSFCVINISSGAANRPIRGWQAYCASKAACKMGLDVLAAENTHVKVIHFDPGVMNTSMQDLIRKHDVVDMPEVEVFRAYMAKGELRMPNVVATDLIQIIVRNLV